MKKKFIAVALILSSICAMAQQKENRDESGQRFRGPYERTVLGATGILV